ncbi:MAG: glycosyltransferase family 39 protein [Candidatus Acidiferrales bacterium]
MLLIFILTLPLLNPWVRGDGVGYYAYARSLLIEHKLDFRQDWLMANASFRMDRIDADGQIAPSQYTVTGHLDNHFSIGPAILWAPFLVVAHAGVLVWDRFGGHVAADGFSRPYLLAMSFGTALYGFLSLAISFGLARRFVPERWAFLATLGIWFGSSLPVYMYFNPSWSHSQSAFTVALFVWYWLRTRADRSTGQWAILGALGGLMMDVYYVSAVVLLFAALESLAGYWTALKTKNRAHASHLFADNVTFSVALVAAFLPTLIAKKTIYGGFFSFGYAVHWYWNSPAFFRVCVSADHGLFSWTPILILAVAGLICLRTWDRKFAAYSVAVFVVYLYVMGCYQDWDGISSFGSRFFVALTPLFVIGLAAFFGWFARAWHQRRAGVLTAGVTVVLVFWNLGLMFQWGMHLIPPRGPISWREAAYNQVAVVPKDAASAIDMYLTRRANLMQHIERTDVKGLQSVREQNPQ